MNGVYGLVSIFSNRMSIFYSIYYIETPISCVAVQEKRERHRDQPAGAG
jgi:hypothetical protein